MQTHDPYGFERSANEAAMHHSPTVDLHDQLHLTISSSHDTQANADHQSRREDRLQKVKAETADLRDKVARIRLELRELRVGLQQENARIWEMQGHFWGQLRSQVKTHPKPNESLRDLQGQIQNLLDEIGPRQSSYDEKEDNLIFLEYRLGKKEARFYELESQPLECSSVSGSSQQSPSSATKFTEDDSSLTHQYLSRVGDANIVSERMMELAEEKAHYLNIEQDRLAMGFQLYEPNVDFLAQYDEMYADHLRQLQEITEDIQNLEPAPEFLSLDNANSALQEKRGSLPGKAPLQAQSEPGGDIDRDWIRRRMSDGDLLRLSDDERSRRESISRSMLQRLGARPLPILDTPDLDNGSWQLVQERGQESQHLQSSPMEPYELPGSGSSMDFHEQKRGTKSPVGLEEFGNFLHYPVETEASNTKSVSKAPWKSRTSATYFDPRVTMSSSFEDDILSLQDGSQRSTRL